MDINYKNNEYYKCLYNALRDSFIANNINFNNSCYNTETMWNSSYYSYLATLDFCENLTMYGDDYVYHNLEDCFSDIRESALNRIKAGKQLVGTTQK